MLLLSSCVSFFNPKRFFTVDHNKLSRRYGDRKKCRRRPFKSRQRNSRLHAKKTSFEKAIEQPSAILNVSPRAKPCYFGFCVFAYSSPLFTPSQNIPPQEIPTFSLSFIQLVCIVSWNKNRNTLYRKFRTFVAVHFPKPRIEC